MDAIEQELLEFFTTASRLIWSQYFLIPLLLGTGVLLTVMLKFMPILRVPAGFVMAIKGRKAAAGAPGEITPFQALTTALAATVGTGNIAGVATAIAMGGPGAVFWMWMTALFGMATKYSEAVLAVKYREIDSEGAYVGGPMYYIRNALPVGGAFLGALFAFFAMIAAFGLGNTVQANSVADAMEANFGVEPWITGVVMAVLTFLVIIGGVKRIARVAEVLVPFMAVGYVLAALTILAVNFTDVPQAFMLIINGAFTDTAAVGGFAGAGVMYGIQYGVARGIFSNESGLGSAAIAHAAARTDNPVRQGTIAMMGTFIDTIVVCTMTALVILTVQVDIEGVAGTMGTWATGLNGAELSTYAFGQGLPGSQWVITFGLVIFALTTVFGWAYYGERSVSYLFGTGSIFIYRLVWVGALMIGAVVKLDLVFAFSDTMNGLMAVPNLIALIFLSGTIVAVTKATLSKEKEDGS